MNPCYFEHHASQIKSYYGVILNELETTKLGLGKDKKEVVAVINLVVNERGCDGASSGNVEGVSYPSKIANR